MCRITNKNHKDKCKQYKAEGRRERNKARKADKLARHLAKCAARREKRRSGTFIRCAFCKGKGYNVFEREDGSTVSVRCEHCNGTTMVKQ